MVISIADDIYILLFFKESLAIYRVGLYFSLDWITIKLSSRRGLRADEPRRAVMARRSAVALGSALFPKLLPLSSFFA